MKKLRVVRGSVQWRVMIITLGVLLAVGLLYLPLYLPNSSIFVLTRVVILAIAVLGLNLLTGYAGQISLGHNFFFAIGAYVSAILISEHGFHYLLTLPIGFALAFVVGFVFSIPALRLKGLYLALVTLGLAIVTPRLIIRFAGVTGGSGGINVRRIAAPEWTGLTGDHWLYYVCLTVACLMFFLGHNLVKGRIGRALRALAADDVAARSMGVNLSVFKSLAFAYSAGFAGVAGGLFSLLIGFVSPGMFDLFFAISLVAAMVVGGILRFSGAVFGALFIVYTPIYAYEVSEALSGVAYGAAIIIVMLLMPGGIAGLVFKGRDSLVTVLPSLLGQAVRPVSNNNGTDSEREAGVS